jgi:hypothetical protein
MSDNSFMKMLVQSLNDVRVIMNDYYTREYVLESLRQHQKDLAKDSLTTQTDSKLTFGTIKEFLKAVVELMLEFNSGSS